MRKILFAMGCLSFLTFSAPVNASMTYVDVNGLVCDFCARSLEAVFGKEESVNDVNVDLDEKVITLDFKEGQSLDDAKIKQLIEDSGYNVVAIRQETKGE